MLNVQGVGRWVQTTEVPLRVELISWKIVMSLVSLDLIGVCVDLTHREVGQSLGGRQRKETLGGGGSRILRPTRAV